MEFSPLSVGCATDLQSLRDKTGNAGSSDFLQGGNHGKLRGLGILSLQPSYARMPTVFEGIWKCGSENALVPVPEND